MITVTSGTCRDCNSVKDLADMAAFGSVVFGPVLDLGLTVIDTDTLLPSTISGTIWSCDVGSSPTCYRQMRMNDAWTGRSENRKGIVWRDHDAFRDYAITAVSGTSSGTLTDMESLIDPYKVTEDERYTILDMQTTATGISEANDLERCLLLTKVFRNLEQLPTWDSTIGGFVTYSG